MSGQERPPRRSPRNQSATRHPQLLTIPLREHRFTSRTVIPGPAQGREHPIIEIGAVRGVTCGPRNPGLGPFVDDPRPLQGAAHYLQQTYGGWDARKRWVTESHRGSTSRWVSTVLEPLEDPDWDSVLAPVVDGN